MKQLQNNFTTPEQSNRLLELGVPADSADCFMKLNGTDIVLWEQHNRPTMSLSEFINRVKERSGSEVYIPCWSVGRLMEIAHICSGSNLSYKEEAEELNRFKEAHKCETIIEAIIMCIEDAHSVGGIDFSKLEG